MESILDSLRNDHRNVARLLDALEHEVDMLDRVGTADRELIRGIAEYFLEYPKRCHHPKEDIVYAQLRERCPQAAAEIGDLAAEHRDMAERAGRLRDTVYAFLNSPDTGQDPVVNAARIFIEAERKHMAMEERHFFPAVEEKLAPEDWFRIAEDISSTRDPLIRDGDEKEFESLRERLLACKDK